MSPQPFQANSGATAGKSLAVIGISGTPVAASNGVLDSTGLYAPSVLVTNTGSVTLFVRMSAEATPVATSLDIPFAGGASRVLSNPAPLGKTGIAVTGSVGAFGGNGTVLFTPGQGGI